jgi:ATP-dependent protease HslVU (ClpYQ) peptidase subunit
MTTLVAIKDEENFVLAADTRITGSDTRITGNMCKLYSTEGKQPTFMGFAGHVSSMLSVTSAIQELNLHSISHWMSVPAIYQTLLVIHGSLVNTHYLNAANEEDEGMFLSSGLNMLVVNNTGIYLVLSQREVIKAHSSFMCSGSGELLATGYINCALDSKRTIMSSQFLKKLFASVSQSDLATSPQFDTMHSKELKWDAKN